MKKYFELLKSSQFFAEIDENDMPTLLKCLKANVKTYHKNNIIFMMDDEIKTIGIVLSGSVLIVKEDVMGNKNILTEITKGQIFGETFVCAGIKKSPVTAETLTGCEVMFVEFNQIVSPCTIACNFHRKLIENMMRVIAQKNIILNQKIEFISKGTTRDKLMLYLKSQAKNNNSNDFSISFSRNELSDFLCVDRSAMSRELCKLRDEKIIKFHKNNFQILIN